MLRAGVRHDAFIGHREGSATDLHLAVLAVSVTAGAWWARPVPWPAATLLVGVAIARRRPWWLVVGGFLLAGSLAARSWDGLAPPAERPVAGWVVLRTDPARLGAGVSAVAEYGGRRYLVSGYGPPGRRLERHLAGEAIEVTGRIRALPPGQATRWAVRHVVARLELEFVLDHDPGPPVAVAANRVRRLLEQGVVDWPELERSLFLGLVIGDDRAQPPEIVEAFRAAGLSHLTAVSGQNVAFVLIAAGPLLRRLRPLPRWIVTIGLVGWFAGLTRFEPSVLRASGMALLAATAFWRGWQAGPGRLLALTVVAVTLLDPLLVHSVGWWLSVAATAGLATVARPLAARLPGPRWLAVPLAVTLAAQLGVFPLSTIIFGRTPLYAPLTNLLAVPVAGLVMVWGLPAGLVAGALPPLAPVVQGPSLLATRWVLAVARLAARLEPGWPPVPTAALQLGVLGLVLALPRRSTGGPEPADDLAVRSRGRSASGR